MGTSFFVVVALYLAILGLITGSTGRGENSNSFLLAAFVLVFLGILGLLRRGKV